MAQYAVGCGLCGAVWGQGCGNDRTLHCDGLNAEEPRHFLTHWHVALVGKTFCAVPWSVG